ncbi:caspase family protein [Marinococcus luteus]|uniref:caspase family protein n=1 Tax=Marinococcus luteus TaxID=1122204 RepID=UPI002ACCFD33|nr:caspase family protein [Marinococcus luteus]MDZ5784616.1 caspase family protein [Marinococcus luteus]
MRKALTVGIDDYPGVPLNGCEKDAFSFTNVLKTNGDGSPNFSVKTLTSSSEEITKPILRQSIESLFADDSEIALLYFSGHGLIKSTGGYLVTPDHQAYDEGISMDEILKYANDSKAKEKVIIFDCCHSGAAGSPALSQSNSAQLAEGLSILTASRDYEAAFETEEGGVFTSLVVSALEGGAADLRGHITPGSVYAYVDQALGPWDQRPIFKTNVSRFTSLRNIEPPVPLSILRKLCDYFPEPQDYHSLDPSYEDTEDAALDEHVAIFKDLQKLAGVGLVKPVDEDHMYYAALRSKACRLTALGAHYWRLVNSEKI